MFFCVPGKYKLDLALPYEVFGDEGKAKFDKAARRLEVTLPVRPAPKPPAAAFSEPSEETTEELPSETDEVPSATTLPEAPLSAPLVVPVADGTDREEQRESLETAQTSDDAEARAAASAAAAVAAAAAFDARGETENQRRWREMHEARENEEKGEKEKEAEEERSVSDAAAMIGETVGDEKASPSADGDAKKVVPSAAKIGAAAPAAAAAYLRPSLRGAAELGDELD